ncbi:MAG: hypothetical protein R3E87_20335 [Burkholderiaceae bacterium]
MTAIRTGLPLIIALVLSSQAAQAAPNYLQLWQQGLTGAYLTAYQGSVVGNSSSLTELRLCGNGRFIRQTDAGYYVPGQASGASKGRITGNYGFKAIGTQIHITYRTDQGQSGSFPLTLQHNGRVNIGGLAFAVQQGGAGC